MIVLDTHVLVWLMDGNDELGSAARALVEDARAGEGAMVSAITPWEVSMLVSKSRLHLAMPVEDWMNAVFEAEGMHLAALSYDVGIDAGRLPGDIHGDPADRILIATARALQCPLLTGDRKILRYAEEGRISAIDARK